MKVALIHSSVAAVVVMCLVDIWPTNRSSVALAFMSVQPMAPRALSTSLREMSSSSSEKEDEPFRTIQPGDCQQKLSDGWKPYILDVRQQSEHELVALPSTDAVVPHEMVDVSSIPDSGDVLVYCKGGIRGKKACTRLVELGVDGDRIFNLEGGIMGWRKEVDSSMPAY